MPNEEHIVSFSGGKDSTAMLLIMLEKGMPIDRVINVDTTKEFPETYDHIDKVEKFIGRNIERVKIDFDYWFSEHVKTKGKMKGSKGYGWPDFRNRWCTALKREAFSYALAGKEYNPRKRGIAVIEYHGIAVIEYHGIAVDEVKRLVKNNDGRNIRYPLAEWGMTEADALKYCYSKGFTWNGLYEEGRSRVSCYCCPLQRMNELKLTHELHPSLWRAMQEMDTKSFRKFKSNYSLEELTNKFSNK
jgi:3'-phosphoadenosine 5'-phosphosulfate sulfotransferase (PAPS reductase)/FAD synthetase